MSNLALIEELNNDTVDLEASGKLAVFEDLGLVDLAFGLDAVRQNSSFSCTSVRNILMYDGAMPSASNTRKLIAVPAGVEAWEGAVWDGSKCTFPHTLHPFRWKKTRTGQVKVFRGIQDRASSIGYLKGVQRRLITENGNKKWAICSVAGTSAASQPTLTETAGTLIDGSVTWKIMGFACVEGVNLEDASSDLSTYNRDLSNVIWAKTNTTAAKDATGADGVANSASKLTATGASGTALQTVTSASSVHTHAPFVRRKTGTGTVDITVNGGLNWQDITNEINSTYYVRVQESQTVTNPQFGFRLTSSGDEIEVDFAGVEDNPFATSPIETVASAQTRAETTLSNPTAGILTAESGAIKMVFALDNVSGDNGVFTINDNTNNNRFLARIDSDAGTKRLEVVSRIGEVTVFTIDDTNIITDVNALVEINVYWGETGEGARAFNVGEVAPSFTTSSTGSGIYLGSEFEFFNPVFGLHASGNLLSAELSDNPSDLFEV